MAAFAEPDIQLRLGWQVGLETDIGGGRENQDDCFVWIKRDDNVIVLCVLDGHGREVGKVASESAKQCLFKYLDENFASLLRNPVEFLVRAHGIAHEHIRNSFRDELTRQGYEVMASEQGYLMKRRQSADSWACVHGGTSCSLAALIGDQLYVANVGDSTGILCSSFGVLAEDDLGYVCDAAVPPELDRRAVKQREANCSHQGCASNCDTNDVGVSTCVQGTLTNNNPDSPRASGCPSSSGAVSGSVKGSSTNSTNYKIGACGEHRRDSTTLVVTAEHSPECPYEYMRLLRFRHRDGNAQLPALVVVYDSNSSDKTRCAPVFERNAEGLPQLTNKGSYYKNVRREWASLVSTPPTAQFQDALAFTRSLGDLHLHTYGVTHLPEVQKIDLRAVFRRLLDHSATLLPPPAPTEAARSGNRGGEGGGTPSATLSAEAVARSTLCLVLATDGVWDNWTYEDVGRFVMDASCLGAVGAGVDGAKRVTISFMQRNALYAKRNFGSSADNATGIVLYLSAASGFPAI